MTTRICVTASFEGEFPSADRMRACAALTRIGDSIPEIAESHAGLHLEGSLGAGDLTWDFSLATPTALAALQQRLEDGGWARLFAETSSEDRIGLDQLTQIEAWRIEPLASKVSNPELIGIKRTNLVRVFDFAEVQQVERWSRDVIALADHVPAIRNWSLARTHPFGPSTPRVCWTHAWEQEFEKIEGLLEDYMASAYHWGWLDGWYDPEIPFRIVEPDLAHLYCEQTRNVLSWNQSGNETESAQ